MPTRARLLPLVAALLVGCGDDGAPGGRDPATTQATAGSSGAAGGGAGQQGAGGMGATGGMVPPTGAASMDGGDAGADPSLGAGGVGGGPAAMDPGSGGAGGAAGADTADGAGGAAADAGTPDALPPVDDRCPRTDLGSTLPVDHAGDTRGAVDLVRSTRLEWREAPDDSLLLQLSAGTYRFGFEDPSGNGGCGVSIGEADRYFTAADCPAPGTTAELDGYYVAGDGFGADVELPAGPLLIWVSCTYWSDTRSGPYRLTIERL